MRTLKSLFPFVLVVIMVSLYWPSLHYLPFFDDKNLFQPEIINSIVLKGFAFELRWLPSFTAAWIDLIFESNIAAQRITNLGLHLATAFVLYSLVRQVSNHVAPHQNNERAALAAAFLFLLHPLTVYAVGYLIQRTILMATLFGLLSISAYFDGLVTRKKAYFLSSAFFYLLSVFSKEHAVLIPAVALALTPLAMPITRQTLRALIVPVGFYTTIALLVIYKTRSVIASTYEPSVAILAQDPTYNQADIWVLSMLTQMTLFFKYMGLMLMPYPGWMSIDMRVPFATPQGVIRYTLGCLFFLLYGAAALRWLFRGGRLGMVGFALLSPWLLFWVELSAVRIQEPFVLYRSYLWIPLIFLVIPAVSFFLDNKIFWAGLLAMALGFSYATHDRLESFSSEYAVWDDAVHKIPDVPVIGLARAYTNRGVASLQRNDLYPAIADFTRALHLDARFYNAYRSRSYAYMLAGNQQAALLDANFLIRLGYEFPDGFNGYVARGIVYLRLGDYTHALQDFDRACKWKSAIGCSIHKATQEKLITDQRTPEQVPTSVQHEQLPSTVEHAAQQAP